ncbi:MAG: glutathione peroxidase [Bacteroidales bacterium]
MKQIIVTLTLVFFAMTGITQNLENKSFHDFTMKDIDGNDIELSQFAGKKLLVVNTASKCGFTSQYEGLQEIYEKYGSENFTVIGFPANNFKNQEPGSNEEIKQFCSKNYGVTFPMMEKISVKGEDQHPLYQWLTQRKYNGKMDSKVKWNFQKYLIDEEGQLVDVFFSRTKPNSQKIVNWIEQ